MKTKAEVIIPGGTIGVLGSGQLGRMFAIAARRMGYRVHTFSPDTDTPTGQVADVEITAPYEDLDAVRKFANRVDVITFEFENVPSATVTAAAEIVPVLLLGPVAGVVIDRLSRKAVLIGSDLFRAALVLSLVWPQGAWHAYLVAAGLAAGNTFFNPTVLPFAAGAALIGCLAGLAARHGMFRRFYLAPVAGFVTGIIGGVVSAPVAAFVFGGTSGVATGAIVSAFRSMGDTLLAAITKQALISDPMDKAIVFTVVAVLAYALPRRARLQFPFVRRHRVLAGTTPGQDS